VITRSPKNSIPKRKFCRCVLPLTVLTVDSIQKDSSNPALFTNRAFTRIKLKSWETVIDDCIKAIELQPDNMKGYYYLAQAQIALRHPNEALNSAMTAYGICLKTHDSSTSNISNLILQAKKEKWEAKERERIRRRSDLLRELEDSLTRNADRQMWEAEQKIKHLELGETEGKEEKEEIQTSTRQKMEELMSVFAVSDPENLKRRVRISCLARGPPTLTFNDRRCRTI